MKLTEQITASTCRLINLTDNHPKVWLIAWVLWAIVLWNLSATQPAAKDLPDLPHIDKLAHFGYFFGGSGLLSGWFYFKFKKFTGSGRLATMTLIGSIVGIIDEYHQSFTPGRSGNDIGDWIADTSGAFVGAFVMLYLLQHIALFSDRSRPSGG